MASHTDVEEYIASFPEGPQAILREIRRTIREAIPGTDEKIRYQIPAVMIDGHYLVHFAGWKGHAALYPVPVMDEPLENEIAPFRSSKDTVKFVYAKAIPYDLIERIVVAIAATRKIG